MSIISGILYGLLSGITEFFPVSARAHQSIMLHLCGKTSRDPLQDLLVHIAILLSLLVSLRSVLAKMHRQHNHRNRSRNARLKSAYDSRLIRTATVPLVIGAMLYTATMKYNQNLLILSLFLIINGAVLLLVDHISYGNKDASTMSGLDGILMGICGSLQAFPGLSGTGMITSYCVLRGADRQNAVSWAVMLCIPAMAVAIIMDIILLIATGFAAVSFVAIVGYILGSVAAFSGAYLGISFLRIILTRSGFSGFAYYSFGAALFSFILHLITW